jgi:hypothetical protein
MGFFMLTLASAAPAQTTEPVAAAEPIAAAIQAAKVDTSAKPLGTAGPVVATVQKAVTTVASAVTSTVGAVFGATPAAKPVQLSVKRDIAKEVAWLHNAGWPLYALVHRVASLDNVAPLDEQANCIAVAVYHEARGESLEGQLAVARVIMNRAASGKYPPTWCDTVKQPWQFSFVRNYEFPYTDQNSDSWRKAVAITRLAISNAVPTLSNDVLWYHADYVAPSWGRRLTRVNKIGTHIFYRA